jgi:GxxExxY protein
VFDEGFRADLLVEPKVVVELKSAEKTAPVHKTVLLTYLRLADCKLDLCTRSTTPFSVSTCW